MIYDAVVGRSRALEAERAALLASARGRILEIGAGTGLNARHYPPGADVTYTEPDARMTRRVEVIRARAESLPFEDASFDTVVSTLVLCSVDDLPRALGEIRRVLAPGGSLLFLEHIRADGRLGRWQDVLNPVWHAIAGGCNCNRRTVDALARVFDVDVRVSSFRPPFVRPVVAGRAGVMR